MPGAGNIGILRETFFRAYDGTRCDFKNGKEFEITHVPRDVTATTGIKAGDVATYENGNLLIEGRKTSLRFLEGMRLKPSKEVAAPASGH